MRWTYIIFTAGETAEEKKKWKRDCIRIAVIAIRIHQMKISKFGG
jgi:hypothetical protein